MPHPDAGLEGPDQLSGALAWGLDLLEAPRPREADAGARLLRLLACKYVTQGGWRLDLAAGSMQPALMSVSDCGQGADAGATAAASLGQAAGDRAMLAALASGCQLAESWLAAAERDFLAACRRGLAAGPLLALRFLAEEVAWDRLAAGERRGTGGGSENAARNTVAEEARRLVRRMLELCWRVGELTLPTLARPQVSAAAAVAEVKKPQHNRTASARGVGRGTDGRCWAPWPCAGLCLPRVWRLCLPRTCHAVCLCRSSTCWLRRWMRTTSP